MRPPTTIQGPFRFPLSTAFRSEAGVRVLRALALHGGPRGTGDLLRETALTRQTVLSALRQLTDLHLVEPVGGGRATSYRLATDHPLAASLGALFAAEASRSDRVLAAARRAATDGDARALWLFGSAARGDDTARSDVDLALVVPSAERLDEALERFRDRMHEVEQAERVTVSVVGLTDADVRRLSRGDPWWSTVTRDAVPLVGDAPSAYVTRLDDRDAMRATLGTPARRRR